MADPQFCLIGVQHWSTCMAKSEWASWVQAVGSIAAIVGTALVARYQIQKQHDLQQIAERLATNARHRAALRRMLRLSSLAVWETTQITNHLRDRDAVYEHASGEWFDLAVFERLEHKFEAIEIADLPDDSVALPLIFATSIHHFAGALRDVHRRHRAMDADDFEAFFEMVGKHEASIHRHRVVLQETLASVDRFVTAERRADA